MAETDTLDERITALEQQMSQGQGQQAQAAPQGDAETKGVEERLTVLEQRMQEKDQEAAQLDTRMDACVRRILDEYRTQGQLGGPPGLAQPQTPAQAHQPQETPGDKQGGADKIYGDEATLRVQQEETARTQQRAEELHQPHSSAPDKGDGPTEDTHQEQRHRGRRHE